MQKPSFKKPQLPALSLRNSLPYLALLAAHIIWGGNFLVAKVTLQEFPPMSLAFLRFALALVLILPFLLFEQKKVALKLADLPRLFLAGIMMTTLNIALFFEAITKTTATNAATISLATPMLSVLLGWIILKEKVFFINIVGIVMGILGSLVIIGLPLLFLGISDNQAVLGNLLIVLSSICWVIGLLQSKSLLKKYSSLTITTICFFTATVAFFLPAINEYYKNPQWVQQVSALGILGLLYITILSSISAFILLEWGFSKLPISRASLFQYVEPLVATTLGVMIMGDRISYSFIVGAIMIGLGVYWGTLGKEAHHRSFKAHRH